MADISKIKLPSGSTYDIVDKKSGFVTTDEKVSTAAVTSGTTYYLTVGTNTTSAETKYYDATGLKYHVTTGTSSSIGYSALTLGNHIASGTAGNKIGEINIYSSSTHFISLTAADSLASDREIALPDKNGTIALTSDIPTVPTITLNGSSTISPSFYAPTSAGTSGYYLKSNGSGAPTWAALPSGGVTDVTVNGTSVVSGGVAAITVPDISGKVDKTYTYTNSDGITGTQYVYNDTYEDEGQIRERLALINNGSYTDNNVTYDYLSGIIISNAETLIQTNTSGNNISSYSGWLSIRPSSMSIGVEEGQSGAEIGINWASNIDYYVYAWTNYVKIGGGTYKYTIDCSSATANRTITLPDKTGTVALTSDIPNISVGYISGSTIYAAPDTKYSYSGSSEFTGLFLFTVPSSATHSESANKTVSSVKIGTNTAINISSYTFNTAGLYSAYVSDNALLDVKRIQAPPITDVTVGGTSVVSSGVAAVPAIPTKVSDLTNDSGFVTTDEKVKTNTVSNDTVYYPIVGSNTSSAATKYYDASGLHYIYISSSKTAALMVGNETAISSNGKKGILRLGGSTQFKGVIDPGAPTADRTYTLPDASGIIALTSDISGKVDKTCTYTNIDGNSGTQTIFNGTYTEDEGTENEYTYNYLALQDVGQYTDTENNTTLDYDSGASFGSGNGHIWASADDGSIADYSTLRVYSDGITMEVSHRYNNSTSTINMGVRNYINDSYAFISADTLKLGKGTYKYSIDCSSPTTNRTLTLPDKSGTIALTSDIPDDEKLKVERCSNNTYYSIVCMPSNGSIPRTTSGNLTGELAIKTDGSTSSTFIIGDNYRGEIALRHISNSSYYDTKIVSSNTTTSRTITLPDATGTVALISDTTKVQIVRW